MQTRNPTSRTLEDVFTPCDGCAQPDHCGGTYPDDDKWHPGELRGCFGEKAKGLRFAPQGTPFSDRERVMAKDNDAYKRLRKDGLQPNKVDGSATLEKVL